MNALTTGMLSETARIEVALDELVSAAIQVDRNRAPLHERGLVSAAISAREAVDRLTTWTEAQRKADELLTRPVGRACRMAIRTLGERLYEIGGLALMDEVCDRLAQADPANPARREGIIDHLWSGIGRTKDSAGRCS